MIKSKLFIRLLVIVGLLFTACDKDDDLTNNTLKDSDGNKYNTVEIGSQIWTVENLKTTKYNDGSKIPNIASDTQWGNLTTGAYCNNDNEESNVATYGRLYNWYAVNTGKLAPKGWHVPTEDDWTILENYLIANGYNYDGTKEGNKISQSLCAKTHWVKWEGNGAGVPGITPEKNNSSGFTALPGGSRTSEGKFQTVGYVGKWWSSTEGLGKDSGHGRAQDLYNKYLGTMAYIDKSCGCSVRLVRD